jgi:hypothetical protein
MSLSTFGNVNPVFQSADGTKTVTIDSGLNTLTITNSTIPKTIVINSEEFSNGTQVLPYVQMYENINAVDACVFPAPNTTTVRVNNTLELNNGGGSVGSLSATGSHLEIDSSSGSVYIKTNNSNQNSTHYLNFSDSSATGVGVIQKSANISCNPNQGSITATTFSGTASTASTVTTTSSNTANTCYLAFTDGVAGASKSLLVDDSIGPLTYTPSTASMSMGILNLTSGGVTTTYRNNCINTVPASPNIFFSTRTTAPSSGTNNVVMGSNAGNSLTSGNNNVILGLNAGSAFTSGSSNFALGAGSLQSNQTGGENVAIGQGSMNLGTGGFGRNVCIGHQSGQNITTTANGQNTCIGYTAGKSITTGSNVTSVGANANETGNTTLTNSTCLGANTNNGNFNSSTAIGANATNTSANQIMLGTASENVTCPGSLIVTTVDATAVGTAVNLFNNSTTGDINIGNALSSGDILIGPQASGSPSSNITIMPRSGWNGTFQVGDNSSGAKLLCATNLEVNYPISTSITTTPSSARHLGYTVNQSTAGWTTSLTSNTQTNITSVAFTSADYGTYLFEAKIQITPVDNTVSRQQILGINTVSANYGVNTDLQYTMANVGHPMLSVMRVLNIYANTTVYLVGYIAGTNGTVNTFSSAGIFSYTRIA